MMNTKVENMIRTGKIDGKRSQGKQRVTFTKSLSNWIGIHSFIHLSSSTRRLTTMVLQLSLSPRTMRERLLCHAHPTGPDLESSSKRRLTTMIFQLSLSLQWQCGSACSVTLTPPGQTRRLSLQALTANSFRQLCFTMVTLVHIMFSEDCISAL